MRAMTAPRCLSEGCAAGSSCDSAGRAPGSVSIASSATSSGTRSQSTYTGPPSSVRSPFNSTTACVMGAAMRAAAVTRVSIALPLSLLCPLRARASARYESLNTPSAAHVIV